MKMIRHQYVCVNLALTFDLGLSKTCQKEIVITVGKKRRLAIVAALNNVMRVGRNGNSGRTCHAISRCKRWQAYRPITTSSRKKFSDPIFSSDALHESTKI